MGAINCACKKKPLRRAFTRADASKLQNCHTHANVSRDFGGSVRSCGSMMAEAPRHGAIRFREVGKRVIRASQSMEILEPSNGKLASLAPRAVSDVLRLSEDIACLYHTIGKDLVASGHRELAWAFFRQATKAQSHNTQLSADIMSSLLDSGGRLLAAELPLPHTGRLLDAILTGKGGAEVERASIERGCLRMELVALDVSLEVSHEESRRAVLEAERRAQDSLDQFAKDYMARQQTQFAKRLAAAVANVNAELGAVSIVMRREISACEAEAQATASAAMQAVAQAQEAAHAASHKSHEESEAAKAAVSRLAEQARAAWLAVQKAEEATASREAAEREARRVARERHDADLIKQVRAEAMADLERRVATARAEAKAEASAELEAGFEARMQSAQAAMVEQLEASRASMQRELDQSQQVLQEVAARAESELDKGMAAANRIAAEAEAAAAQVRADAERRVAELENALVQAGVKVVHVPASKE